MCAEDQWQHAFRNNAECKTSLGKTMRMIKGTVSDVRCGEVERNAEGRLIAPRGQLEKMVRAEA